MALINCKECSTEVSDKAEICPKCSYPIGYEQAEDEAQVIEQTGKELKKRLLISYGVLFAGLAMLFSESLRGIGVFFIVTGVVLLVSTKMSIWWHHS